MVDAVATDYRYSVKYMYLFFTYLNLILLKMLKILQRPIGVKQFHQKFNLEELILKTVFLSLCLINKQATF